MKKIGVFIVIFFSLILLNISCQSKFDTLHGNWWGIDTTENYVEFYISDSVIFICDSWRIPRIDIFNKSDTSFGGFNLYQDTIFYFYKIYTENHIAIYNNENHVELFKMTVPVRTPFNTTNYLDINDTIWQYEISQGRMIRYQLFRYIRNANLLDISD